MLFIGCIPFLYLQALNRLFFCALGPSLIRLFQEYRSKDLLWNLIFQLQMVDVPLTVLLLAAMGVRSFADIALHFLLLSAAVNTLWLQSLLKGSALYMSKCLTVGIPAVCCLMTLPLLAGWESITALMASISLAPLLIMPFNLPQQDGKFQMRLGSLCTSGALLTAILNLAML